MESFRKGRKNPPFYTMQRNFGQGIAQYQNTMLLARIFVVSVHSVAKKGTKEKKTMRLYHFDNLPA